MQIYTHIVSSEHLPANTCYLHVPIIVYKCTNTGRNKMHLEWYRARYIPSNRSTFTRPVCIYVCLWDKRKHWRLMWWQGLLDLETDQCLISLIHLWPSAPWSSALSVPISKTSQMDCQVARRIPWTLDTTEWIASKTDPRFDQVAPASRAPGPFRGASVPASPSYVNGETCWATSESNTGRAKFVAWEKATCGHYHCELDGQQALQMMFLYIVGPHVPTLQNATAYNCEICL